MLSPVTFTLGDNVENLTLNGYSVANGYGNALNNVNIGNIAANTLDGGIGNDTIDGGRGNAIMTGGVGNDTYTVMDTGDQVIEAVGGGSDAVISFLSAYTFADNVESLTLGGFADIAGTGNGLDNVITGNSAWNRLDGGAGNDTINGNAGADTITGGLGQDTMTGGTSSDTFVFKSLIESTEVAATSDLITDFSLGDRIDLSAIDARFDQAKDQPFVLDANSVLAAGEVMQVRSGNVITVSVLTTPAVTGAEMVFRVQVDSTITGVRTADSFIL